MNAFQSMNPVRRIFNDIIEEADPTCGLHADRSNSAFHGDQAKAGKRPSTSRGEGSMFSDCSISNHHEVRDGGGSGGADSRGLHFSSPRLMGPLRGTARRRGHPGCGRVPR
jgi:hypothetical protein